MYTYAHAVIVGGKATYIQKRVKLASISTIAIVEHATCRVHAVTINTPADDLYNVIGQRIEELGVRGVEPRDLIDLIDGYHLGGHGCVNKELKGISHDQM